MELDWHGDRSDLPDLALLDQLEAGESIDLGYNIELLRRGVSFHGYSERAWTIPERFVCVSAHGCGMTGEYPYLYHSIDFADSGYDGVVEAGMTLCVESYIGYEGVKLEQQLLITDDGPELLSTFPFEASLLGQRGDGG